MLIVYKEDKPYPLPKKEQGYSVEEYKERLVERLKSSGFSPIVGYVYKDKTQREIKIKEGQFYTRWVIFSD